ncbi:MAG: endopeptidase La [Alloprevotella sp.]|nr:endopeptidase La [Alloprevotella sp.]MBR1652208.1 endopeptidase La [Alloprevotella sp.]
MDTLEIPQNPFSIIADFEGDIAELFRKDIPSILPVFPLRNMMVFPGVVASVSVGRQSSQQLVRDVNRSGGFMAVFCQKDPEVEEPGAQDLYEVGVVGRVMRLVELPMDNTAVILQSFGRVRLERVTRQKPYMRARIERLPETLPAEDDREYAALADTCKDQTVKLIRASEYGREEVVFAVRNMQNPVFMVNFVCTNLPFPMEEKQRLLAESDQKQRAYMLSGVLNREYQYASLKQNIQNQTREELDQQQREYFLQQQIKNIQHELGDTPSADAQELRERAKTLDMPQKVRETFEREVQKLERYNTQSPDYSTELTYLQTLVGLPWGRQTEDNLDLRNARRVLDRDHYGMEKAKERILEHLAVLRLRHDLKAPILCLYGPPGVGKTSLGKSIATALGRQYVRISLGGVHDEAEIRGHRRTYIGAMPGRIIKGLQKAESDNPVFILDEIDKISPSVHNGDPQSAMLEVLDPEQNAAFHDNYLDVDYDLSKVLFIATANTLSTIPAPLLDRMEVIELEGYLTEEKREIARRHLIPRIEGDLKLAKAERPRFSPKAMEHIIERYTRESGVRQLEKQLEKIYRKLAYRMATEDVGATPLRLQPADVERFLGKPRFSRDRYQGNGTAGVVTGLAWTSVGGEILFIETSLSRSKAAKLTVTGNLGDVMKESAVLALEYVKSHADALDIDYRIFEQWSLHIHVPEGATPKDGPSAGITIATSIASAVTQRKVRQATAMTGEITLRGRVLPVGGIKEKILAAKRAGIQHIVISEENRPDVEEIPAEYLKGVDFCYVQTVEDVLRFALLKERVAGARVFDVEADTKEREA